MVYRHCDCCGFRDEIPLTRKQAAPLWLCDGCIWSVIEAEAQRDGRRYWLTF